MSHSTQIQFNLWNSSYTECKIHVNNDLQLFMSIGIRGNINAKEALFYHMTTPIILITSKINFKVGKYVTLCLNWPIL